MVTAIHGYNLYEATIFIINVLLAETFIK